METFSLLILMLNIFCTFSQKIPHEMTYVVSCSEDGEVHIQLAFDTDGIMYIDFEKQSLVFTLPPSVPLDPYQVEYTSHLYKNAPKAKRKCIVGMALIKAEKIDPPEEKEPPESALYPAEEVQPGVENSLICFVNHFYPPRIRVTWTKNGDPVTEGVSLSQYYPNKDQTFHQLSTLKFTPNNRDIYTCTVEHIALASPQTRIWEAEISHPSVGADVFCGVGLILGLFGVAGGTFLAVKGHAEWQ